MYVNDKQDIIKVSTDNNYSNIKNIEVGVGIIGSIIVPVLLILCVYRPIAYCTFGKSWVEFYRNFEDE